MQLGQGYLIGAGASVDGDQFFSIENLEGGLGADQLFGNSAANSISGNSKDDLIIGRDGNDSLSGGTGNDIIHGQNGADTINGGDGNDLVLGGAGGDTMVGGLGNDTIAFYTSSQSVSIDLATASSAGGDASGDAISGFENAIGSTTDDVLFGNGLSTSYRAKGQ